MTDYDDAIFYSYPNNNVLIIDRHEGNSFNGIKETFIEGIKSRDSFEEKLRPGESRVGDKTIHTYNNKGEKIDLYSELYRYLNIEGGALTYLTFIPGDCRWIDGDKTCDYGRYVNIPGANTDYRIAISNITGKENVVINGEWIEINEENVVMTEGKWMDINVENVVRTENGWVKKYVDYTVWVPGKYEKIQ